MTFRRKRRVGSGYRQLTTPPPILLSDEAVVRARRGLTQMVQNVHTGVWSFGHGSDVDTGIAERMAADLGLLPPA